MSKISFELKPPTNNHHKRLDASPRRQQTLRYVDTIRGGDMTGIVSEIFGRGDNFEKSVLYGCKIS